MANYKPPQATVLVKRVNNDSTSSNYHNLDEEGMGMKVVVRLIGAPTEDYSISIYAMSTTIFGADKCILSIEGGVTLSGYDAENKTYYIDDNFQLSESYNIRVEIYDTHGGYAEAFDTLTGAFYTMHVATGGKNIVFGGIASDEMTDMQLADPQPTQAEYEEAPYNYYLNHGSAYSCCAIPYIGGGGYKATPYDSSKQYYIKADIYPKGLFRCDMEAHFTGDVNISGQFQVVNLAGEIKMWAGNTVPYGWLLCDGSEVSKKDYPELYGAIGDLWGVPSSSLNFKLPNLTGRVPVGYNAADTDTTETFGQVGATGGARGAWYHTHTIGSSGAHHHASVGRVEGSGSGANIFESFNGASKTRAVNVPRSGSNGAHTHSPGSSGSTGNKLAVDKANMPPYAVVKYIICAF